VVDGITKQTKKTKERVAEEKTSEN